MVSVVARLDDKGFHVMEHFDSAKVQAYSTWSAISFMLRVSMSSPLDWSFENKCVAICWLRTWKWSTTSRARN